MENNTYTYHGIPGTRFIWHGEWSDPEVEYQGRLYNGNSLEDTLWSIYKTECEENSKEPSEEEFDNLPTDWFTNNFLDITMEDINEAKNMKKNVIKLNEAQLRNVIAESVKKVLIRESESDMFYPGKLLYNIKSEKLVGDMGYEFCDFRDLGSISPEIVKRGIIEHFQEDYPNEELYPIEDDGFPRQCEVLYVEDKNHNAIDNIVYISSQDAEYADAIKSKLGGNSVVKVVAPTLPESKTIKNMKKSVIKLNETQLRKVVTECVKKVLTERGDYDTLDWDYAANSSNELDDPEHDFTMETGINRRDLIDANNIREAAETIMDAIKNGKLTYDKALETYDYICSEIIGQLGRMLNQEKEYIPICRQWIIDCYGN